MTADSASDYAALWVFSLCSVLALWNSHRHAAEACAGDAWQVRNSPGGSAGCRVDRLTPGPRRPAETMEDQKRNGQKRKENTKVKN